MALHFWGASMLIVPNNWAELQHYKDRNPPWIKLHKKLLDNYEFQCLPVASRALAPMLWLLASEHPQGQIDANPEKISFRLRLPVSEVNDALAPLIAAKFFSELNKGASKLQAVASKRLAKVARGATPETETETEKNIGGRFAEFWNAWPKNERKQDKKACREKWLAHSLDVVADSILADVQAKKATRKWRDGFIEAPEVYINNRRWEDAGGDLLSQWWTRAGFSDQFEAENAGCRAHNAAQFRDGKRIEEPA